MGRALADPLEGRRRKVALRERRALDLLDVG
jgi:hypothetical protein